jgi:outer membrane protein TolC
MVTVLSRRLCLFTVAAALLCGCRATGPALMKSTDNSMANIRCMNGLVGAPPPPANANVDHVPVPFPVMPDPRTLQAPNSTTWDLDLNGALAIALGNSEVVRVLPGATTTTAGSSTTGSSGGISLVQPGTSGTPISNPGMNNGSGGFGASNANGGFGPGGQANAVTSGAGSGTGGQPVPTGRFATIYDPAIAASQVQSALGAFDVSASASMFWEHIENPPDQTFGGFLNTRPRLDTAYWNSSLTKLLASGATAGISYYNNYYFVPPPNTPPNGLNPQYQTHLEFSLLQPMLRGAGTQVNRANILVAGARANQTSWEFKRRMMAMVRSVETAYWNLYSAQIGLQAIDDALPLYAEVVRIEEARIQVDAAIPADAAQAKTDYLSLRTSRLGALSNIATQQALLRNLMGMPPTDGRLIRITEKPLRAPLVIDWNETIEIALDRRPDIIRQRLAVHIRELQLLVAKNGLLPMLNGQGLYKINGVGSDLSSSTDLLSANEYQSWQLGASFQYPLGNNVARGQMRAAQMQLLREQALLKQNAHIATHQLADIVRELYWVQQQYEVAQNRLAVNAEWRRGSRARFLTPSGYVSMLQALQIYLAAIRTNVSTVQEVAALLAEYNIALAKLEESKGTLLADHNIGIFNDPCTAVQRTVYRPGSTRLMEEITGATMGDQGVPAPAEPVAIPALNPGLPGTPVQPGDTPMPPMPPIEHKELPPPGDYKQPLGEPSGQGVQLQPVPAAPNQLPPAVVEVAPAVVAPRTATLPPTTLPAAAAPIVSVPPVMIAPVPQLKAVPAPEGAVPAAPARTQTVRSPLPAGSAPVAAARTPAEMPRLVERPTSEPRTSEGPRAPAVSSIEKGPARPPVTGGPEPTDYNLGPAPARIDRSRPVPVATEPRTNEELPTLAGRPAVLEARRQPLPKTQTTRIRESDAAVAPTRSDVRLRENTVDTTGAVRDKIKVGAPLRIRESSESGSVPAGQRLRITVPEQSADTDAPAVSDSASVR